MFLKEERKIFCIKFTNILRENSVVIIMTVFYVVIRDAVLSFFLLLFTNHLLTASCSDVLNEVLLGLQLLIGNLDTALCVPYVISVCGCVCLKESETDKSNSNNNGKKHKTLENRALK